MGKCLADSVGDQAQRRRDAGGADVPRQRLGLPVRMRDGSARRWSCRAASSRPSRSPRRSSASTSRSPAPCPPSGLTCCATPTSTAATCRSIETMVCGGAAVPLSLIAAMEERQGVRIAQGWGMTETSPLASVVARGRPGASARARAARCRSSRPGSSATTATELPWDDEATGELQVRGPWIAQGVLRGRHQRGEVRRRLAAHRRHRGDRARRLAQADRPLQGRHQVRWRVDLVGRAGERADGAPVRSARPR